MQTPLYSSSNQSETTLFISDLHLCASRPGITAAFVEFLQNTASKVKALYILGDLFDYWAGDDDIDDAFHQQIINGFKELSDAGVNVFLMHGNRDFLIAEGFCQMAGITLLDDPTMIDLHGKKALLSHGDDLCVDDVAYQQFRTQVRDKKWQREFLSQPLQVRKKQIEAIRARSEQEKTQKSLEIMDVNAVAVNALLSKYQPDLLIHGHTHRPGRHTIELDGRFIIRWVLGDWYEQGSYLACDKHDCKAMPL
jgi:UDP-2,3-diacylglucosamine hydrolase